MMDGPLHAGTYQLGFTISLNCQNRGWQQD